MPKILEIPHSDYFPGDILLKRKRHPRHWVHKLIIQGHNLPGNTHQDPYFVHAAIVGAYGPTHEIPLTYEVSGEGIYSSRDHQDDPACTDYKDMSSELWIRYRWVTDFDGAFAQIMKEGHSQVFLEETVQPLLKLAPNPFRLEREGLAVIKAQISSLVQHSAIDKALLEDGYELRQFIKACAVFALRERVAQWGKALYEAKRVHYDHWGAVSSVLGPRFRQAHLTEQQLNELLAQKEISPPSDSAYFCSQFVVQLWTLAPLDLLPEELSYHERKHFLPLKMNLETASPAGLYNYFQENPEDWKTVIGPEEQYRVALLKRILQTTINQDKGEAHTNHIKRLTQCHLWYELLDYLEEVLSEAPSWTKDVFGRLVLDALEPWHPMHQSFDFPFSVLQVSLLKAILNHLPSSPQQLAERVFPVGVLTNSYLYEELLWEGARCRAAGCDSVEVLEVGYLRPLTHFLGWTEAVLKAYPPATIQGVSHLLASVVDYVHGLREVLSSRPWDKEEKTALQFIETGILNPLEVTWGRFWGLLSPHELLIQINGWGQGFLKGFLRYRRMAYEAAVVHPLLSLLENYPDETGWTVKAQQKLTRWREQLEPLHILSEKATDYVVETVEEGKPRTYFLNQAIGEHLFKKAFERSRETAAVSSPSPEHAHYVNEKKHAFYRCGPLLLKLQKEQGDTLFGNELMVHQLHDALGLDVLPSSALWRIKPQKGPYKGAYYCWVSEFVEGDLLGHVMQQDPQKLEKLSCLSVSGLYVLALATCQEDANPFNMIISLASPDHLRAFDVGHAFILPLLTSRYRKLTLLELKSLVFLLPQMELPLDSTIQEKLMLLKVPRWLQTQKQGIQALAQGWKHWLAKENPQPTSPVELPGTAWLWVEFILTDIQTRLRESPALTHEALFAKLLPMVASYYQEERLSLINLDAYRAFDFTHLNKRAYNEIIIRSPEGKIRMFTTSRDRPIIRQMQQQGDKSYRKLLSHSMQNLRTSQDSFKAIKIKRYAFALLQILSAQNVKEVDLSKNLLVQDQHVVIILNRSPQLEKLVIRECIQLTGRGWLKRKLFQGYSQLKLDISRTTLEDHFVWESDKYIHHVLSWTKPRKIFLEQFNLWKQSDWRLLESQPFNLSLTGPEEEYLAEKIRTDETLQAYFLTPMSARDISDNGLLWLGHPLLRYRWFCNMVRVLLGNKILHPPISQNQRDEGVPYDCLFKILLIGDSYAGKSRILYRYTDDSYNENQIVTIACDFKIKNVQLESNITIKLQIWDTAGLGRFRTITTAYLRHSGANGIALVFDVTDEESFENIRNWKRCIDRHAGEGVPIILLANKCDWVDRDLYQDKKQLDDLCEELGFIGWFKTSAKLNLGIDEAMATLTNAIAVKLADSSRHIRIYQNYSDILETAQYLSSWPHVAKTMQYLLSLDKYFYTQTQPSAKNTLLSFMKDFSFKRLNVNEHDEIDYSSLGKADKSDHKRNEKNIPEEGLSLPSAFKREIKEKLIKSLDDLSIVKTHGNRFFITSQNNDKKIVKSRSPEKIITLGNGNCLFNTVALGLCDLVMKHKLTVIPKSFFTIAMNNYKLSFQNSLSFREWITNHIYEQQQEELSPLLRFLAINHIETHYENYRDQFENILRVLFQQQRNEENSSDENHFLKHEFIRKQILYFAETEDELIGWWQREGKGKYFAAMKGSADHSHDKKQWGGEIELDALGLYLGIRIVYHKKPARGRPLGILGGLVPILREGEKRKGIFFTEGEKELLNSLGFGHPWSHYFHLEKEFFARLENCQPLSEKDKRLIQWFINNKVLAVPTTSEALKALEPEVLVLTEKKYQQFLSCLQARGIVKQSKDKNLILITEDSAGMIIDKERITQKISNISEGLRAKLTLLSKTQVPEFEVIFGDDHWEYLSPQVNANLDDRREESHIVSGRRQSF